MGIYNRKTTSQKRLQKSDLGASWAPFGTGFGRILEALGASWAVLRALFFMLVFGVVFKSALGAVWLGFWFDFNGFWEGFGRFGRNLRAFWVILGLCGLFWAVGVFWADFRKILAGAPCCNGIHFELKL